MDVSVFWVFVAGLFSFLSPCVLPLVPGYVSMLSGVGVEELKDGQGSSGKLLSSAFAFVIGFSAVFIAFGASASAVGSFLLKNKTLLAPVAGALIVLFGLHLVGWLVKISVRVGLIVGISLVAIGLALTLRTGADVVRPVQLYAIALIFLLGPSLTRWLNRDVHLRNVGGNQPGVVSGFLMGFAFAFGWTPCIGPILAAVLAVAATRETIGQGVLLLACYSAGLAIPFLLTALGIGRFLRFYQSFRKHLHRVEIFSGALLLAIGALVFFNALTFLSGRLSGLQPENLVLAIERKTASINAPAILQSNGSGAAALGDEPNVTFKDLQANNVTMASLKGKVVLVNFWATWCDPCREETPMLMQMQQEYGSKGFTVLGIAMDEEGTRIVDPFVRTTHFDVGGHSMTMNYPIVLGSDAISDKFGGLLGMPTSFLISRDGKIVKKYIGSLIENKDQFVKDVQAQL
jgi:cytochrome c-type biogenesis protein